MPGVGDYGRPRERLEPEWLGWNCDNDEICDEPRDQLIELTLNDVWVRDPGVVALTETCKFSSTVTYALMMRPGAGGLWLERLKYDEGMRARVLCSWEYLMTNVGVTVSTEIGAGKREV